MVLAWSVLAWSVLAWSVLAWSVLASSGVAAITDSVLTFPAYAVRAVRWSPAERRYRRRLDPAA